MGSDERRLVRHARPLLAQAGLIAVSIAVVRLWDLEFLSGDPVEYYRRMSAIQEGGLPYFDVPYEHFPLMLVPMGLVWLLGGSGGAQVYRAIWVLLTTFAILASTRAFIRSSSSMPASLGPGWVVLTAPMLPLLVFRTEPWVVLTVALATERLLSSQPRPAVGFGLLGTAAKGWPVVLTLAFWAVGWRRLAVYGGIFAGVIIVSMTALPGFMDGRAFSGYHTESVAGTIWGLRGSLSGSEVLLVEDAGAIYTDASWQSAVPGIAVAVAILGSVGHSWRLRSDLHPDQAFALAGACVAAFLLVSPLQSAQFVYWLAPFVVLARDRGAQVLLFIAGLLATVSVATFESLEALEPAWFGTVLVRHLLIAAIGWQLSRHAARPGACGDLRERHAAADCRNANEAAGSTAGDR